MGEVREIVALSRPGMRHQHSRQNTLRHDGPQQHRKAIAGRSIQSFACNSPGTVSHHTSTSLELQRLKKLLKVHPIELHAKLLRVCATNAHVDPLLCACAPLPSG